MVTAVLASACTRPRWAGPLPVVALDGLAEWACTVVPPWLVVVVTALEAFAVPMLERHAPLRGLRTRRDAWRHPRKYLLPAVLLLAFALIRLG